MCVCVCVHARVYIYIYIYIQMHLCIKNHSELLYGGSNEASISCTVN